jgi:hypothetical protein
MLPLCFVLTHFLLACLLAGVSCILGWPAWALGRSAPAPRVVFSSRSVIAVPELETRNPLSEQNDTGPTWPGTRFRPTYPRVCGSYCNLTTGAAVRNLKTNSILIRVVSDNDSTRFTRARDPHVSKTVAAHQLTTVQEAIIVRAAAASDAT